MVEICKTAAWRQASAASGRVKHINVHTAGPLTHYYHLCLLFSTLSLIHTSGPSAARHPAGRTLHTKPPWGVTWSPLTSYHRSLHIHCRRACRPGSGSCQRTSPHGSAPRIADCETWRQRQATFGQRQATFVSKQRTRRGFGNAIPTLHITPIQSRPNQEVNKIRRQSSQENSKGYMR